MSSLSSKNTKYFVASFSIVITNNAQIAPS